MTILSSIKCDRCGTSMPLPEGSQENGSRPWSKFEITGCIKLNLDFCSKCLKAFECWISAPVESPKRRWRQGGIAYTEIGRAELRSREVFKGASLVIYKGDDDEKLRARLEGELLQDGRFEEV